jgi:hypothetical protein
MDSTGSTFFPVEDAFVNKNIGDTQLSEEYFKQTRVLAKYREPFQLTGYSVEEHLGCDAGVFYSENSTQTVTLQTALPFLYLESQTPLSDILGTLNQNNINDVVSDVRSFENQHYALNAVSSEMIPEALDLFDLFSANLSSLPTGASFNTTTGTFSWTPASPTAGVYTDISFEVSDGIFTDSENITITVASADNDPPMLAAIGDRFTYESDPLQFAISATDPGGDNLSYSIGLASLPSGASFNEMTRVFSWTPAAGEAGVYTVHFEVSDGELTDSEDISITVQSRGNDPPWLYPIGNKSVNRNEPLEFVISATDPDSANLTYSADLSSLPSGASFDEATAAFSWTPASGDNGTYTGVHFEVTDGEFHDSENITITVNLASHNPTILDPIGNKVVKEGEPLEFTISATGPRGNPLANRTVPIIVAYELTSASKQMDELVSNSYIMETGYSVDLTNEPPTTGKILAMRWYNATTKETDPQGTVTGIVDFVTGLGFGEEDSEALGNLMIIWSIGGSAITKVGNLEYEPETPPDDLEIVKDILSAGIDVTTLSSIAAIRVLSSTKVYKDAILRIRNYAKLNDLSHMVPKDIAKVFHQVGAKIASRMGLAAGAISGGLRAGKFMSL